MKHSLFATVFSFALFTVCMVPGSLLAAEVMKDSRQAKPDAIGSHVPSDLAIQRLAGGLRIPTVGTLPYKETNFAPFKEFKKYLRKSYPKIYKAMETEVINEYGLLFRWKGKDPKAQPLLFLSHYDVVPAEKDGNGKKPKTLRLDDNPLPPIREVQTGWSYPAFSGAVADGRIYGRGALDMKGMLFSIMEAADALVAEGFVPEQDIWFAFGHDEETGGMEGAWNIAEHFHKKGLRFAAVFDEGGVIASEGSILGMVQKPIALVGMGEKGFLTLRIKVRGIGGHSSMPAKKSSLVLASEIVARLNENQLPARITPPIASFLKRIAPEGSAETGAASKSSAASSRLLEVMAKEPAGNALVRTTTAITMMHGSDASNVVSSTSEISVNFRILPGDTIDSVKKHVEGICRGYDTEIEVVGSSREASSLTDENSPVMKKITDITHSLYPEAIVAPYLTIGGTDAYKYQKVSENIFRFMPIHLNQYEQGTIHNDNEYLSFENYGKMIAYFKQLMQI